MAVSKRLLAGSTSGRPIPVAAVATPGTLVHTAIAGPLSFDEVYVFASNITNAAAKLTLEWGGVTDPGDHMVKQYVLPANSPPFPVVTGVPMNGGLAIRAFSDVASAINLTGFVNRIE
jgi:hypothetical protein